MVLLLLLSNVAAGAESADIPRERQVIAVEDWIIPEPDEQFAAVEKSISADWYKAKRPMLPTNFTDRSQIALNIGGLLADAHIAIEAGDAQGTANYSRDMYELCKGLGIGPEVKQRIDELTELSEAGDWRNLKLAINQMGEIIRKSLASLQDENRYLLIRVGAYLRGIEVLSAMVAENYDTKSARLVRQPHLAGYLSSQLTELPEEVRSAALHQELAATLNALREIMDSSDGFVPSNDAVVQLNKLATQFNATIASPPGDELGD